MSLKYWNILNSNASSLLEPAHFLNVLTSATDIALVVSYKGETLASLANSSTSDIRDVETWVGGDLRDTLTVESIDKLERILSAAANGEVIPPSVELNHSVAANANYPVRYATHLVEGEDAVLLLGRDLKHVAETQQQLMQAQIALERGHTERRNHDARYRMLLATTRDAIVFISASNGKILDLNAKAAELLGRARSDLEGTVFSNAFETLDLAELKEKLAGSVEDTSSQSFAARIKATGREVALAAANFRVLGEQMIICRLDPDPGADVVSDSLAQNLEYLFHQGVDGIVLTDKNGVIKAANSAFVEMVDYVHHVDVRGNSLADYLGRGQIDLTTMLDATLNNGQMPLHGTRLLNSVGEASSVEVTATALRTEHTPVIAFTMRDVSRVEIFRPQNQNREAVQNQDAVKLVGEASLKEIVAATSETIEEMCIAAALEMTKNNRAAAAELLGLSRQSLYVKLRKFGMISS